MNNNTKMIVAVLVTAIICVAGTYMVVGGESNEGESVSIRGSTTIQPLMVKYQEEFEKYSNITMEIAGGGSGAGIAALRDGTADIGMVSRALTASEISSGLVSHVIGKDAVAIIVNADVASTVTNLTQEQLVGIFDGTIKNWNELGGPNRTIAPVIREDGSGTRECFELFSGKMPSGNTYSVQGSTGGMINQVNQTPGAIGYVSMGSLISACHPLMYKGVTATAEHAMDGTYEMVRDLVLATTSDADDSSMFLINWILSPQGQKILKDTGFLPI